MWPISILTRNRWATLDYQPTSRDHFYPRYIYQDTPLIAYFDAMLVAGESVNVQSTTHSIGGDWTHTFSPRWVDQLRYSFQQARLALTPAVFRTAPSMI